MTDSGYPRMGFSVARNDTRSGVLELESYAATSSARGDAIRFSVRNLPDPAAVRVRRDGVEHGGWRVSGPGSIEIETRVGSHAYEIFTGYRGNGASRSPLASRASSGAAISARTTLAEVAAAAASVGAGAASCPCCAAAT